MYLSNFHWLRDIKHVLSFNNIVLLLLTQHYCRWRSNYKEDMIGTINRINIATFLCL